MLVMDPPRPATFRGKRILTAHLLSTLPSGAGTSELLAFAKKLGMKAEWMQHRGGYNEHFDLMGTRCQAAKEAGALVDRAVVARTGGSAWTSTTAPPSPTRCPATATPANRCTTSARERGSR